MTIESGKPPNRWSADEGGDPARWAQLLCPECGAVIEGAIHPEVLTRAEPRPPVSPPEDGRDRPD